MKNLILLLSFFCFNLISIGQVKFNGSVETGYEDRTIGYYDLTYDHYFVYGLKENLYCSMKLNSNLKGFNLYANAKFYFALESKYNPPQIEYIIGAKYNYKRITIGYDHKYSNSINKSYLTEKQDRLFLLLNLGPIPLGEIHFNCNFEIGCEDRKIGFYDLDYNPTADSLIFHFKNTPYGTLRLESEFKRFNLYTNIKTYFIPENRINYIPIQVEYKTGLKYSYKNICVGYEHMCSHSIDKKYFREGYDRLFLHFNLFSKTFDKK